jgi:hypothetical protein
MDKFEMGDRVVCIRQYETLRPGIHYTIKGCGDLSWNMATDKKGYGFCIEDEYATDMTNPNWWKVPTKDRLKWYYFTESEMNEIFITQAADYASITRDLKISSILDGN